MDLKVLMKHAPVKDEKTLKSVLMSHMGEVSQGQPHPGGGF